MNDFLQDISSLYWWLSVVVIGILVDIAARYIPDVLGKVSSRFRVMAIERNERVAKEREEKITFLMQHPDEIVDELIRARGNNAIGDRQFLLAVALMIIAEPSERKPDFLVIIFLAMAAFAFIRAIRIWHETSSDWDIAREARFRLRENSEDDQVEG
jgi:hypothetical protein